MRVNYRLRTHTGLALASVVLSLGAAGCAKPCFDDGINQGGCPEDTDPSATASDDATADATATRGGDATAADGTDTQVGTAGGSGFECPDLEVELLPQIPTFQLVIDQSGSMDQAFDGTATRWEAVENTLVGPDGVVTTLEANIRFGASFYTNSTMGGSCPAVQSLAPQLNGAMAISDLFASLGPDGDTPTGESIELITGELLMDMADGDKVMVLATDGEPDTCDIPEPMPGPEAEMARMVAVDAVAAAYTAGIRTFVISVGPEIAEEHLQDLANAGQGVQAGDPDAEFYVANDNASLVAAFNAIVSGLRPCTFPLDKPLPATSAPSCSLTINDSAIPYDDPDGWVVRDDEVTLELQGMSCDAIQEGAVAINLMCSC